MSIPGIFAPVRVDGMVLVDGGIRDNYPTALARQMGADIIIGVDLSDTRRTYRDVNNIGDIIGQGIDMLSRDAFDKNVNVPDVKIKPVLSEYNMMSFSARSIDTIIVRGRQAAERQDSPSPRSMPVGQARRQAPHPSQGVMSRGVTASSSFGEISVTRSPIKT